MATAMPWWATTARKWCVILSRQASPRVCSLMWTTPWANASAGLTVTSWVPMAPRCSYRQKPGVSIAALSPPNTTSTTLPSAVWRSSPTMVLSRLPFGRPTARWWPLCATTISILWNCSMATPRVRWPKTANAMKSSTVFPTGCMKRSLPSTQPWLSMPTAPCSAG